MPKKFCEIDPSANLSALCHLAKRHYAKWHNPIEKLSADSILTSRWGYDESNTNTTYTGEWDI